MGSTEGQVRAARSPRSAGREGARRRAPTGRVVAVTGASSVVGEAVTAALADCVGDGVRQVIAVDEQRGAVDGVRWRVTELSRPAVAEALDGADVVVHIACPADLEEALAQPRTARRARAVRTARAVFDAAVEAGARRVVLVTSAMVYGADPDNPIPLLEDAPLRAASDHGLVGDMLEVEQLLAELAERHPSTKVTAVRPAALVGPRVDTVTSRHFEAPRLLTLSGTTAVWQFCHLEDLGSAVATAVRHDLDGALTVGCEGVLTQAVLERISGMRRLELSAGLAFGTAERLHRVGALPMPVEDLAYVVHPWIVSSARLRAAGWRPRYDNETCLGVLLEQVRGRHALAARRVDRKDAALGAAGAAVALVGTAAVWRQARARRRGRG